MIDKMVKISITILGMILGVGIVALSHKLGILGILAVADYSIYVYIALSLALGIISFILSSKIIGITKKMMYEVEKRLQSVPASDIVLGAIGLVVGLYIANLLGKLLVQIPYGIGFTLSIVSHMLLGYLGIKVLTKKREDFANIIYAFRKNLVKDKSSKKQTNIKPKILDTSVIIDGRISDICNTGFVEGPLVIPEFVLSELQRIADSSDGLKRTRGRRGLDILNKIQKELDIEVIIHEKDFEDIPEVDTKLLKLAQHINGKVVTNDYNLNKVAEVHGVEVLNINELANAIKPVVIPGEDMTVQVIKIGKEASQGVAYLDDGTMIVVEGGSDYIGKTIGVLVTSVLQTAAGRMIFAKPKNVVNKAV